MIGRSPIKFFKNLIIFGIFGFLGLIICLVFVSSVKYNIINWLWHGIIYAIILVISYLVMSLLFYKDKLYFFKKYLFGKGE